MSKLLAPNGKPSNLTPEQYKLVRTSAFKKWFGDWENDPANASKVVDSNGEPLVCYHTSDKKFTKFNYKLSYDGAIWFTENIQKIIDNETGAGKTGVVYEVFLDIKKMGDWDDYDKGIDELLRDKFNGAKMDDDYIVFEPEQIKLADGSNTSFDSNNDDIRYEEGGEVLSNIDYEDLIVIKNKLKSGAELVEAYLIVNKTNPFVSEFKNRAIYCLKFSKNKDGKWHFYNVAVGFTKEEFNEIKNNSIKSTLENSSLLIGVQKKILYELLRFQIDYLISKGYVLSPLFSDKYGVTYSIDKIDDDFYVVNESFFKRGKLVENNNALDSYANLGSNVFNAINNLYKKAKDGGETKNKIMEKQMKINFDNNYAEGGVTYSEWLKEDSFQEEFNNWMEDDNVIKNPDGTYSTQDAQYRNSLKDMSELQMYFYKEFIEGQYAEGGEADSFGKGGNVSSIEKRVEEVNKLIELANANDISVIDSSVTWESPMKYKPVRYSNGVLYVEYQELDLYKYNRTGESNWVTKKDKVLKRNMEFDNPLNDIAKMYRKALREANIDYKSAELNKKEPKKVSEKEQGFDDAGTSMVMYHEAKGNFMIPKGQIYLWLYEGEKIGEKLQNEEYDYVFYPYSNINMAFQKGFIPPLKRIWTKKFQKDNKGSEHLLGVIKAYLIDKENGQKELYVDMMSVNPTKQKKGIMSYMIKELRDTFNLTQDQVTFSKLTPEGEKFVTKKTYADGGWLLINADTERIIKEYETESEARQMSYEYDGDSFVMEKSELEKEKLRETYREPAPLNPATYIRKDGGGVGEFPPKGELTNKDNFLLKYEKKGSDYEFLVYKPITKEVSGYNQIKHVCLNKDCPQKMNYEQFINYLYAELYLDDNKYADGGEMGGSSDSRVIEYEMAETVAKRFDKKEDAQSWINENSKYSNSKFRIEEVPYDSFIDYRVVEKYERRKMADGGGAGDCIEYIKNSESIKNNGYYLHIDNMNNYIGSNSVNIPKINSLCLITFNSGGQKNLKSVDTINSMLLASEIAKLLNIDIEMARIIVYEQTTSSKPYTMDMLDGIKNQNIIVADRDTIVCTNLSMNFADSGEIESEINELYSKSNFINNDFNWQGKLLEMLQDNSVEAYNVYQSLTDEQKEEVLQELYEIDNDMGSYGDGDIETSKENLEILLEGAKNGNKYGRGGFMYEVQKKGYPSNDMRETMFTAKNLTELKKKIIEKYGTSEGFMVSRRTEQGYYVPVKFENGGSTDDYSSLTRGEIEDKIAGLRLRIAKTKKQISGYETTERGKYNKIFQEKVVPLQKELDTLSDLYGKSKYEEGGFVGLKVRRKNLRGGYNNYEIMGYDEMSEKYRLKDLGKDLTISATTKELKNEFEFVDKYEDGGEAAEYQIIDKKTEKYYSLSMSDGKIKWNDSPDMGYMFTMKDANQIKESLLKTGYEQVEVVKYDSNWWKKAKYEKGGAIYPDLSLQKADVVNDSVELNEFEIKKMKNTFKINGMENTKITSSQSAVKILRELFSQDTINAYEEAYILYLNKNNKVIGYYHHSSGGIDGTVMDVQMISGMALKSLAKGVIIAHNHPSENTQPSDADRKITNQLKDALKLFNIYLMDSIILTDDSFFSFSDDGLL